MDALLATWLASQKGQPVPPEAFEPPAIEERRGLHPALKYGPTLANLLDAWSTQRVLSQGGHESNPLMRPLAGNPALMYGAKGLAGLLMGLAADRLAKKGHPTLGKVVSGIGMTPALAATYNLTR